MFKYKYPMNTEEEHLVGLLSKDEAEAMPLVPHQVRRTVHPAPAPTPASAPALAPAPTPSAAAAAPAPTPGPGEVVIKKAALVTMKKQMAALIRGEDLPAAQTGAQDTAEVPYQVTVAGRDDTQCPVCQQVF